MRRDLPNHFSNLVKAKMRHNSSEKPPLKRAMRAAVAGHAVLGRSRTILSGL
jgi:hypothetical protein